MSPFGVRAKSSNAFSESLENLNSIERNNFSDAELRGIRVLVKKSSGPAEMEKAVVKEYGSHAIKIARRIAAGKKIFEWKMQAETSNKSIFSTPISRAINSPVDESVNYAVGQSETTEHKHAGGTEFLPIRLMPGKKIRAWIVRTEIFFRDDLLSVAKIAGLIAVLFFMSALWDQWSIYSAKRDREAEMQSVGTLATAAGSMYFAAYRECVLIGIPDVSACALSNGILVQDIVAKRLSSIAIEKRTTYEKICTKYYSNESCYDLLNRAFRISQRSE
jgi:hypothetical protein